MKSFVSMPFLRKPEYDKYNFQPDIPSLIEEEPSEPMSPKEIRRFVHNLRESRQLAFADEFLY